MLQFIFGKPSSGKTYTILQKIKELSFKGEASVLIVPEQYTFESERSVLKCLGDKASKNVSVLSFSRLYDEIGRCIGGISQKVLTDSDKVIFMHRALVNSASELKVWKKYVNSISFAKTLLDTISEFKINGISSEEINEASENVTSSALKSKLQDISIIYKYYDLFIGEKFIDPSDKLTRLYDSLSTFKFFDGKTVFIDSFKGFTGQQRKIIERIISQAENTYISITNNPEINTSLNVFTNIRIEIEKIRGIAKKYGVTENKPIILKENFYNSESISSLERLISGDTFSNSTSSNITLCEAKSIFDEAEFVARTIRRLVRTKNLRFKDFVIITRDFDKYYEAVATACKRNNVQCFYDNKIPLSSFPLSVSVKSAIKALDFSTSNILKFHKTGLGTLNTDEISKLQNYTYIWNIDGNFWLKEWDMDTRGFVTDEKTDKTEAELKEINALRTKAIMPIINFKNNFSKNAKVMTTAIINLLKECDSFNKLSKMSDFFKNTESEFGFDYLKVAYDEFINILDSLVYCFGEKDLKNDEYFEALELSLSLSSVGVVPQMLDEVTFGSADRIRPSRPKIAFILGANQGVFPKLPSNSGILNNSDRKSLIEQGIEIADNTIYSSIDEDYLVYCNLCCPSDELYISYSSQSLLGETTEPSAFVAQILENLPCSKVFEPDEYISSNNLPETAESAFSEYCRRRQNFNDAFSISTALKNTEFKDKLTFIEDYIKEDNTHISKESATKLFGRNINMSASKFETFNRCKFSFFCKYGLNLKRLQPAEFDVMQRGTIIHYVLERLITEHSENISKLSVDDLNLLTDKYINEYLSIVAGYKSIENTRLKFLVSRLSRSLKEVVIHISEELSQSEFKPVSCELKIGKNSDINLEFPFDDGKIFLNGSIDRVDEYNGFIRIIDYKSGDKQFKLPDIVFGLNLQMLIYLYAVIRGRGLDDSKAAGILYQPSKRDLKNKGLAMNGLLKNDNELISAMESDFSGRFVPAMTFNKDGSLSKRCNSFINEENFTEIFNYIEKLMKKVGNTIVSGEFCVDPLDSRTSEACKYCDFSSVCGIENRQIKKVPDLDNDSVFEILREAENNGI